jgi:hypothetical protein
MSDVAMVQTNKGPIPADQLVINEVFEDIPCGKGKRTEYFFEGEKVRWDYEVIVSKEAHAAATGEVGKL